MNKKKLLFVTESFGGGVFTYLAEITNELINKYDITIAYSIRMETPLYFEKYFDSRTKFVKLENFTRSINPIKDIRAFFEIKKLCSTLEPDIVHLHSSKAGAIGRLALKGDKISLYYTPHGYSFLMMDNSQINRVIYRFVEKICAKKNCTTISCSPGEHAETLKITKNAVYVNNGIDTDKLSESFSTIDSKKESGNTFTVFTLGRICTQKNPDLFNKIASLFPEVRFIWIGDGDKRCCLDSGNIEVTGWVTRETALKTASSSDAFLLPSLWEGLPISLLESMYMKKICIVSNVIGNRDVIHNGINGFVCNNIDEYANAIRSLMDSSLHDKNRQLTENAFNDVLNIYNTKIMGKEYIDIYEGEKNGKTDE